MRLKSWYSGSQVETAHVELVRNEGRARHRRRVHLTEYKIAKWRNEAACRDADPALFHQEIPQYPSMADDFDDAVTKTLVALDYCRRCSVVDECAADRVKDDAPGVWGGARWKPTNNGAAMTNDERFVA